jgi:transposase
VPVKTIEQQSICQLHRIRQLLVKQKTMHINALRGHLAELGIVRAQGPAKASELMRLIEDAADDVIPAKIRDQLRHLVELVRDLHHRLAEIDRELGELAREDPAARRLATIPGIGPVTVTALAGSCPWAWCRNAGPRSGPRLGQAATAGSLRASVSARLARLSRLK